MDKFIKYNNLNIPSVPFLWYKEKEIVLPIEKIFKLENDLYVIIQINILNNKNIYICHHSYFYSKINKEDNNISKKFRRKTKFKVKINKINLLNDETTLNELGIKENIFVEGLVRIHYQRFSPSNIFHFQVNQKNNINSFLCYSKCDEYKLEIKCLFIIINKLDDNIDNILKEVKFLYENKNLIK